MACTRWRLRLRARDADDQLGARVPLRLPRRRDRIRESYQALPEGAALRCRSPVWANENVNLFKQAIAARYKCIAVIAAGGDHNVIPKLEHRPKIRSRAWPRTCSSRAHKDKPTGDHKPDSFRRGLTRNNTCMSVIRCGRVFFRIVWVCSRRGTKRN